MATYLRSFAVLLTLASTLSAQPAPIATTGGVTITARLDTVGVEREALDAARQYTRAFRKMYPVPGIGGHGPRWAPEYLLSPAARARAAQGMMSTLASSAAARPADTWITDLLIEQALRMGAVAQAKAVADRCGAERWWCEMLQVYVMHRIDPLRPADSLLTDALARMPADTRCAWGDVSLLLSADYEIDHAARERYEALSCMERAAYEERLWWLSDPMYSVPGNERRTEHFAREVRARLDYEWNLANMCNYRASLGGLRGSASSFLAAGPIEDALADEPGAPGLAAVPGEPRMPVFYTAAYRVYALLETSAGYGGMVNATAKGIMSGSLVGGSIWAGLDWPDRAACPVTAVSPAVAVRLGAPGMSVGRAMNAQVDWQFMAGDRNQRSFVPHPRAIDAPFAAVEGDWELIRDLPTWLQPQDTPESGVSRVGPMFPIEWQTGYFLRGDSARLVVAADVSLEPALRGGFLKAALAVSSSPSAAPLVFRQEDGPRFVFSPIVPADSAILSLEVQALRTATGRIRVASGPPPSIGQRLSVSDPLLYMPEEQSEPDRALDDVAPRTYPFTRFGAGEAIGVFWEEYGLLAGEVPTLGVSLVRDEPPGVLSRLLGAPREVAPIRLVGVEAPARGTATDARHLTIDLSGVEPGRYRLELTVSVIGQVPVRAQRKVEVCASDRLDCL